MKATIATICARGGSKGLPGKNLRQFAGKPLIAHTIRHALNCRAIDGVYVSTDDEEIAQVARQAGAIVPYLRSAELATDEAGKLPVVEHLVSHLERHGEKIGRVVDLQPTSPLREFHDIPSALLAHQDVQLVVSVCHTSNNPYFTLVERGQDGLVRLSKGDGAACRQDVPAVYSLNGSIYVWERAALAHASVRGMWSVTVAPYVMDGWKSADIDTQEDFDYAQWCYDRHMARGEFWEGN